jgi:hypothetical protein
MGTVDNINETPQSQIRNTCHYVCDSFSYTNVIILVLIILLIYYYLTKSEII